MVTFYINSKKIVGRADFFLISSKTLSFVTNVLDITEI